jgi:hypothetical protein
MKIRETYVNVTKGYRYGETEWYEPYTENIGRLFKSLQKEYGRCISKIYIDGYGGQVVGSCGWVFQKKIQYEDCKEFYVQETWVEVQNG